MPSIRSRRKSNRRKVFSNAYDTASKALNVAMKVKSLLNVEYKHIDVVPFTDTPGTTPSVYTLNACAEGDGSNQRSGISLRLKNLRLKGYYVMHGTATNTSVRIAIILDRSPNSNEATFTDVYESASVVTLPNNVTEKRFKILKDTNITLSGSGEENGSFDWYFPMNHITRYSNAGGTPNDIETNQVLLMIWSNDLPLIPPCSNFLTP